MDRLQEPNAIKDTARTQIGFVREIVLINTKRTNYQRAKCAGVTTKGTKANCAASASGRQRESARCAKHVQRAEKNLLQGRRALKDVRMNAQKNITDSEQ